MPAGPEGGDLDAIETFAEKVQRDVGAEPLTAVIAALPPDCSWGWPPGERWGGTVNRS